MRLRHAAAGMAIALALAALIIARDLGLFRNLRHHSPQRPRASATALAHEERCQHEKTTAGAAKCQGMKPRHAAALALVGW